MYVKVAFVWWQCGVELFDFDLAEHFEELEVGVWVASKDVGDSELGVERL